MLFGSDPGHMSLEPMLHVANSLPGPAELARCGVIIVHQERGLEYTVSVLPQARRIMLDHDLVKRSLEVDPRSMRFLDAILPL